MSNKFTRHNNLRHVFPSESQLYVLRDHEPVASRVRNSQVVYLECEEYLKHLDALTCGIFIVQCKKSQAHYNTSDNVLTITVITYEIARESNIAHTLSINIGIPGRGGTGYQYERETGWNQSATVCFWHHKLLCKMRIKMRPTIYHRSSLQTIRT